MIAITKNPENPSHGACKFDFPCCISSPNEGDPGGKPYPRKSSAVRVVIEPVKINGRNVIAETIALGRAWRYIMVRSLTPKDRAARI